MERRISFDEFLTIDKKMQEIMNGLLMESGSLARLTIDNIESWLKGKLLEQDRIERLSEKSYLHEYTDENIYKAIENAIGNAQLEGNSALNSILAIHVVEKIIAMNRIRPFHLCDAPFRIADAGAGKGATTLAVFNRINMNEEARNLAQYCKFYIIDPSDEVIEHARQEVRKHGLMLEKCINYKIEEDTFRNVLEEKENGFFDMIYSTAVFHHCSFPRYLSLIQKKLTDDGILVLADWYMTIWKHPAFSIPILREFGANERTIDAFRSLFDIGTIDYAQINNSLPEKTRRANNEMIRFVFSLGKEMSRFPPESRLHFLEAHESIGKRVRKIRDNGLVVDLKELKEKHKAFVNQKSNIIQVFPRTTIGQVILAANIPGKKPAQKRR